MRKALTGSSCPQTLHTFVSIVTNVSYKLVFFREAPGFYLNVVAVFPIINRTVIKDSSDFKTFRFAVGANSPNFVTETEFCNYFHNLFVFGFIYFDFALALPFLCELAEGIAAGEH